MKVHLFEHEQLLPSSLDEVWDFFATPANLDKITPTDLGFRTERCGEGGMYEGQIIIHQVRLAPLLWMRWVTEIKAIEPRVAFVDEQRAGPFKFWHHRHSFEESDRGVVMRDAVNYAVGFGPIGEVANALFVGRQLAAMFAFRREAVEKRFGKA